MSTFKCEKVIKALTDRIPTDGPKICDKVNAVYLFEIEEKKGGPVKKWTVDLKNKPGKNQLTSRILQGGRARKSRLHLHYD